MRIPLRPFRRKFNCTGPCYPDEHYYVRRDTVMERVKSMIHEGAYFVVHAPRQMGKTTLLENMLAELETQSGKFIGVCLDFEFLKNATVELFYGEMKKEIDRQILKRLANSKSPPMPTVRKSLAQAQVIDLFSFRDYINEITHLLPDYQIAFVIDEFDGCPDEAMKDFLHTLRSFYLAKKRHENFRNLNFILVGVRDFTQLTVGTVSPFNIAQNLYLENFSPEEVRELYKQYTLETGQSFSQEAVESIYKRTCGQPFLVNRFGVILTEEMNVEKQETITASHVQNAMSNILRETNNNFKTILVHAQEYKDQILRIISGFKFNYDEDNPLVMNLRSYGLIREQDGVCVINNPIYQNKILSAFRPTRDEMREIWQSTEGDTLDFENFYSGNVIRMGILIENFKKFMDRIGLKLFRVTKNPQEVVGQFLLASFIDLAITNIGGTTYIEVPTGIGRMDIIAIAHNQKYIIETKLWTGEGNYQAGLKQLADYMRKESVNEGYYVIFDLNLNGNEKELEKGQYRFSESIEGAIINVFIIRIKPKPSSLLGF